jgi:rhamnogalacturonyl hydrolase YesR
VTSRRSFMKLSTACLLTGMHSALHCAESAISHGSEGGEGLSSLPPQIRAMIANVMANNYAMVNTDWDGSIRMEGLLRFATRGNVHAKDYAVAWLNHHIDHDGQMTDEQYYKQYQGPHTRIIRREPLTFTLYSANLGVAFPAYEIFSLTGDSRARAVCFEVADVILQTASRDRFGMLSDDDDHYHGRTYAIPDTTYWATRASAIAYSLSKDPAVASLYLQQAILQLDAGIRHFFDHKTGLVRTGLFGEQPAKTYWCRSQGWLLWAIAGMLRVLPSSHPSFYSYAACMAAIGDAAIKHQSPEGAFHVLVDDSSTPLECTGVAMVLSALREGMRKDWIDRHYEDFCQRAWAFILRSTQPDGSVRNAYTGWAATAEERQTDLMDRSFRGFVSGVLMLAADEMTCT